MAQLVKCPTLAQVMISQFVDLSPASGSVLTPQSLEPALDSVFPSLSALPMLMLCLCLSVSLSQNINIKKNFFRGAWVAQSIEHPTLAQVMISRFVSLSPTWGSLLSG